ncbi:Hypothetical predicted protein [Cloeon dipterum]|uniref:AB hydrolase-1 domain-containing protein n=1 Tax=Cloeon dipterum TaxID=197152 RepID=A0A8S1D2B1_9INSE|nr:Hypothetical predicted protein [Cloeon dipterum]
MENSSVYFTQLTRGYESITVPVPWGHIAGKWWGPRDVQPVIAMHGWHENANTWDPLMNLMPADLAFLAVDMPGNGLSSHFPSSTWYHTIEDVSALRALIKHFQWTDPVSFLCHSYSTGHAYIYAAFYPNEVARVIAVDFITSVGVTMETFLPGKHKLPTGGERLDRVIDIVDGVIGHPPELTLEQHAKFYCRVTKGSLSLEAAKHVLQRSMVRSDRDPSLYRSTRDPRGAVRFWISFTNEFILELGKQIKCEYYVISSTPPPTFAERLEVHTRGEQILRASAKRFELVRVEGTHHVHLDHPERILPLILRWIRGDDGPGQGRSLARGKL